MEERKPKALQHWWTSDECRFLDKLGAHGLRPDQELERKAGLLRQYLQAIPLRSSWGDLQPGVIQAYAQKLLERLQTQRRP